MSYQKLIIAGNLGRDPEMRYLPSGQAVTNFSVATNRQYTASNGERVKETVWFRVSAWGRQAEICNQYLRTGAKVLIEGRLTPDRETGGPRVWGDPPRASYEMTADRVVFMSGRDDAGGYEGGPPPMMEDTGSDDDIPF